MKKLILIAFIFIFTAQLWAAKIRRVGEPGDTLQVDYIKYITESLPDSQISWVKLTKALQDYIDASGGGSIVNNPDDITLETKPGNKIGVKNNGITTLHILNETITANDLEDDAVITRTISLGAVGSYAIANGSILEEDLHSSLIAKIEEDPDLNGFSGNVLYLTPAMDIEDSLEALSATAAAPWTVILAPGLYTITDDIDIPCGNVSIIGLGEKPEQTQIYSEVDAEIFSFTGNDWSVSNIMFKRRPATGIDIYMIEAGYSSSDSGSIRISNCVFDDSVTTGGGIQFQYRQAENSIVENCRFLNRKGQNGDGIYINTGETTSDRDEQFTFMARNNFFYNLDNGIRHGSGVMMHFYYHNNTFNNCLYGLNLIGTSLVYQTYIHLQGNEFKDNTYEISVSLASNRLMTLYYNQLIGTVTYNVTGSGLTEISNVLNFQDDADTSSTDATRYWVGLQAYLTSADIASKQDDADTSSTDATRYWVGQQAYLTSADIASKQDDADTSSTDATRYWVGQQAYLTSADIASKQDDADTSSTDATRYWVTQQAYLTSADIASKQDDADTSSTDATRYWVGQQAYLTSADIASKQDDADTSSTDATRYWVGLQAYITETTLTDSLDARGFLTSADLSGYQQDADTSSTDATRYWVGQQAYLTSADIASKQDDADTSSTDATRYWVGQQAYLTSADIAAKQDDADTSSTDATRYWVGQNYALASAYLPLAGGTMAGNLLMGSYSISSDGTAGDGVSFEADGDVILGKNLGIGTSPVDFIHAHKTDGATTNYFRFTNSDAGATSADGFIVGLNASEDGILWNFENRPVRIATNNIERMRIEEGGDVGIGTINPATKLHIYSDVADDDNPIATFENTNAAGGTRIKIIGDGATSDAVIQFSTDVDGTVQNWAVGIDGSDSDKFKISKEFVLGTNDCFVIDTDGRIGFGTSSPSYPIDLEYSYNGVSTLAKFTNTNAGTSTAAQMLIQGGDTNSQLAIIAYADNHTTLPQYTKINAIGNGASLSLGTEAEDCIVINGYQRITVNDTLLMNTGIPIALGGVTNPGNIAGQIHLWADGTGFMIKNHQSGTVVTQHLGNTNVESFRTWFGDQNCSIRDTTNQTIFSIYNSDMADSSTATAEWHGGQVSITNGKLLIGHNSTSDGHDLEVSGTSKFLGTVNMEAGIALADNNISQDGLNNGLEFTATNEGIFHSNLGMAGSGYDPTHNLYVGDGSTYSYLDASEGTWHTSSDSTKKKNIHFANQYDLSRFKDVKVKSWQWNADSLYIPFERSRQRAKIADSTWQALCDSSRQELIDRYEANESKRVTAIAAITHTSFTAQDIGLLTGNPNAKEINYQDVTNILWLKVQELESRLDNLTLKSN